MRDARATEHKSTQIICSTHAGAHRLITNSHGRAVSNYIWFSCIQIFAESKPRDNKQTSSGVQGLDFAPVLLHMRPGTEQGLAQSGGKGHLHLGRQRRAAQSQGQVRSQCPHANSSPLRRHWWEVCSRFPSQESQWNEKNLESAGTGALPCWGK